MINFNSDVERNEFFANVSSQLNLTSQLKYVDGILYKDDEMVTDTETVKFINDMFVSFDNLSK